MENIDPNTQQGEILQELKEVKKQIDQQKQPPVQGSSETSTESGQIDPASLFQDFSTSSTPSVGRKQFQGTTLALRASGKGINALQGLPLEGLPAQNRNAAETTSQNVSVNLGNQDTEVSSRRIIDRLLRRGNR